MKRLSLFFFTLITFCLNAQPEVIPSDQGDIAITPILHSTMVLEWDGRTIFVDPYGGAKRFTDFGAPDLVLITDIHGDHLNPGTLEALDLSRAELIAPQAVIDQLENITFRESLPLATGEQTTWQAINIEAVPMYNLPETEDSRHPKGRGNGYVLTVGGIRIYISGDTEDIPEMRTLKNIDVAFVCMNLPYTMNVDQAADAVLAFRPKVVYPFHFRGKDGFSDVEQFKKLVNEKNPGIEVRLRDWYPEG